MKLLASSVDKLLPQGGAQEQNLIEEIVLLNQKVKDDFTAEDEVLLAKLRLNSSETQAAEAWLKALLFSQEKLCVDHLSLDDLIHLNSLLTGKKGWRQERVTAGTCEFPVANEISSLMEEFQKKCLEIANPVSRAAFIYQSICSIHPFLDGNGRTARLAADHCLISNGLAPLIFPAPTMAFVVPSEDEVHAHLLALRRVKESAAWVAKLFNR